MKRVTRIGGIFFKSKDAEKVRDWYRDHLGIESIDRRVEQYNYGRFTCIMDREGNRIELWEPRESSSI